LAKKFCEVSLPHLHGRCHSVIPLLVEVRCNHVAFFNDGIANIMLVIAFGDKTWALASWNFFWIFSVDSFVCLRTETIVLYHNVKLFPLKKISYFAHSRKSLQGIKAGFAPILNKKLTEKFYNHSTQSGYSEIVPSFEKNEVWSRQSNVWISFQNR